MEVRKMRLRSAHDAVCSITLGWALADSSVARLNELGVGRNDRVAIVLPNSAEMAAAFVAIGCARRRRP